MIESYFSIADGSSKDAFIVLIRGAKLLTLARDQLREASNAAIQLHGIIFATPAFYNPGWSFHLDPASIAFHADPQSSCDTTLSDVEHLLSKEDKKLPTGSRCSFRHVRIVAEVEPPSKRPLRRPSDDELSATAKELFSAFGLPVTSSGWAARLDADLASEASLSSAEISKRIATLNPRWTEMYVQDVRAALGGLESDLRYFDDLRFRLTNQVLDLKALDDALRIHNDEIAAGYYTVASEISKSEFEAAGEQKAGYEAASAEYSKLFQNPEAVEAFTDPQRAAQLRAVSATALVYSPYQDLHDQFSKGQMVRWAHGWNTPDVPTPLPKGNVGDSPTDTPTLVYYATRKSAVCEISAAAVSVTGGRLLAEAGAKAAKASFEAKARAANWAADDISFRRDRAKVQIELRELRRQAIDSWGGPLNLTEKCLTIRKRFIDLLAETVARAEVIASTLQSLYGVVWSLPPPKIDGWDDAAGSYLAALQAWYADLDTALSRMQERESALIVAISMRNSALKEFEAAKVALKTGKSPSLLVGFKIPSQRIGDLRGARVRAVSISTIEKVSDYSDSWHGRIRPPISAVSIDLHGNRHSISQNDPFAAEVGRILSRANPRQPDSVGTIFRNCCPTSDLTKPDAASTWTLEIAAFSVLGKHAYELEDVVVEVVVTGLVPY